MACISSLGNAVLRFSLAWTLAVRYRIAHPAPHLPSAYAPLSPTLTPFRFFQGAAAGVPAVTKLEKIDEVCAGTLFGGGGATLVQLSADGRWVVVADDR